MSPKRAKKEIIMTTATPTFAYLLYDAARTFLLNGMLPEGMRFDIFALSELLADLLTQRGESPDYHTHLFTSLDPKNVAQVKFLDTCKNTFPNTRLQICEPWEADAFNSAIWRDDRGNQYRHFSHSAKIAFFLGAFYARKNASRIMLLTDSYDLKDPILSCVNAGIPVSIVWFGQFLDTRYRPLLREHNLLEFWDLDLHPKVLSGAPAKQTDRKVGLDPFA